MPYLPNIWTNFSAFPDLAAWYKLFKEYLKRKNKECPQLQKLYSHCYFNPWLLCCWMDIGITKQQNLKFCLEKWKNLVISVYFGITGSVNSVILFSLWWWDMNMHFSIHLHILHNCRQTHYFLGCLQMHNTLYRNNFDTHTTFYKIKLLCSCKI